MRRFANKIARCFNYFRHAGHAADEDQFVDFLLGQLGVGQTILHRLHCALDERIGELLEL